MSMYAKYVQVLAKYTTQIFTEMTGTEVLKHQVKPDERPGAEIPLAHIIAYEHMDKKVKGNFILGFHDTNMAVSIASALAENMGLPPVDELDEIAVDLLNEFMNTIVGRTISEWDRLGMSVRFGPPSTVKFKDVTIEDPIHSQVYIIILSLTFSQVIFRVSFIEESHLTGESKRILVVEDSAVIRNIISRTLQQYHFEVQQASNGKEATKIYKTFNPQLVIMDLVMPQMGGFEAMETIRKFDPRAQFVVLTSSSRRDEVIKAKRIGVHSYLIKPFNPDLLMKTVYKVFSK